MEGEVKKIKTRRVFYFIFVLRDKTKNLYACNIVRILYVRVTRFLFF